MKWPLILAAGVIGAKLVFDFSKWTTDKGAGESELVGEYYEVRLTEQQRLFALDALRAFTTKSASLKTAVVTELQLGRKMPGPSKPLLDFDGLHRELGRRGDQWSVADLAEEGW